MTTAQQAVLTGPQPVTLWLTGLSGTGKSTLARALEQALHGQGRACAVLDGDHLRQGLNRDLGFSPQARSENIRRAAEVARLMNGAGLIVISAFISPCRADRAEARRIIGDAAWREVHVSTPLAVCELRDPKALYAAARRGELPQFTGVSAPYEAPLEAHLTIDTSAMALERAVVRLSALALGEAAAS